MMELNINCIDGWPQITNEYVYFAVLASNVLQFQDGSKAAVAAGNARNKMDGINSEQEEVLVVVTSSSPTKTKRAAATTSRNSTEKEGVTHLPAPTTNAENPFSIVCEIPWGLSSSCLRERAVFLAAFSSRSTLAGLCIQCCLTMHYLLSICKA